MSQTDVLTHVGLTTPEVERIPIDTIEIDGSKSQVRGILYDRARLDQYTAWVELGVEPDDDHVPVLARNGTGLLSIVSGAHTCRAFKNAGAVDLPGRILDHPTPKQVAELAVLLNVRNGVPMEPSELIVHGIELIRGGQSIGDVCRKIGVRHATLKKATTLSRVDESLAAAGIDPHSLSITARQRLHRLRERPTLQADIGKLISDAQLDDRSVGVLVKKVAAAASDAAAQAILSAESKAVLPAQAAGFDGSQTRKRAIAALRQLETRVFDQSEDLARELAADDEVITRMADDAKRLAELVEVLRER